MGVVFMNIEDKMLNMACASFIGAANGMRLDHFMTKPEMILPEPACFCVALTAMVKTIISSVPNERALDEFVNILEQTIVNLKMKPVEGPKRV